jgi:hypothetical protein
MTIADPTIIQKKPEEFKLLPHDQSKFFVDNDVPSTKASIPNQLPIAAVICNSKLQVRLTIKADNPGRGIRKRRKKADGESILATFPPRQ